jgi:flagellar basal body-associated protein FliL
MGRYHQVPEACTKGTPTNQTTPNHHLAIVIIIIIIIVVVVVVATAASISTHLYPHAGAC